MSLEWHDSLSTDLISLDHEHQKMFDLANAFIASLADRGGESVQSLDCLDKLAGHAAEHFAHEETVMRNIGFPLYRAHKRHHDMLLQELKDFAERINAGKEAGTPEQMRDFIEFWLMRHISREDRKITEFLHKNGNEARDDYCAAQK